jgi:putative transposase
MNRDTEGFARRLDRLPFVFDTFPLYFVTFCTINRQPLLANAAVHEAFCIGGRKATAAGVAVGRYVIMPDHIHCFLRIGPEGSLSSTVKRLREGITKRLRQAKPGLQVWQSGFFDHVLRSSESYSGKWEYVRQNPVRANLCKTAEEWPFQGEIAVISM